MAHSKALTAKLAYVQDAEAEPLNDGRQEARREHPTRPVIAGDEVAAAGRGRVVLQRRQIAEIVFGLAMDRPQPVGVDEVLLPVTAVVHFDLGEVVP